jgi:hypothetical protein
LGRGFDDWVWAAATVLKARLDSGNYSVATIVSFASNGIKVFFPYLTEYPVAMPLRPSDMTAPMSPVTYAWLRLKYPNGSTAKNYYSAFKSVVVGLMDYGFIDQQHETLLPANPFPMNGSVTRGETSLSQAEMQRLATALKADLIAIHHGRFCGLESEATVVLMLMIGHALGHQHHSASGNETGLLGPTSFHAQPDAGQNFKRRGKGAQSTSLAADRYPRSSHRPFPWMASPCSRRALEMTQSWCQCSRTRSKIVFGSTALHNAGQARGRHFA